MSGFVYREPAKVVQDIIQSEMELNNGQVMFTNQKFIIPTDGLFIAVSYVGPSKVISRQDEWLDDGSSGLNEIQTVTMLHMLQIDIMSFDDSARIRKEEIVMALGSLYSEQQQEQYSMQISRNIGPIMDTSSLELTKMLTRYTMTINTTSVNQKTKGVEEFYTDFSRAVPPMVTVNA